jgi:predicted dehydrogenase
MSLFQRRKFLQQSSLCIAGSSLATSNVAQAGINKVNTKIRIGIIGLGGQGKGHLKSFLDQPDVEVGWLCDVDQEHLKQASEMAPGAKTTSDLRHVLDDASVVAVSIATPDHWHTPAALLALQAGKHVYVEKPCSHNVREGRLLVEAAQRTGKLVQHGTQSRSAPWIREAMKALREGVIGDVVIAKAWNVQYRPPIGHAAPSEAPANFDYDTWLGPAPFVPFQANRHHYTWHWWYDFGTGDAGNDGVHELDIARWGLGVDMQPSRIAAIGGKYIHDDDQQFPDTMTVAFEYPTTATQTIAKQLIFEMRLWSRYNPFGMDNANEYLGTKGRMLLTKRGKVQLFDERGKEIEFKITPDRTLGSGAHQRNFVAAIRGEEPLHADALTAHLSSSLPHLANVACRLGRSFQFQPNSETIPQDAEANRYMTRQYREGHWSTAAFPK